METAYFAGGCFWCITPTFKELDGVLDVVSGYSGGTEADPTYESVKTQQTGHRETIRIDFDPLKVSFAQLLQIFLDSVDPFDGGGQFIDRGHSYTLAVYWTKEVQKILASNAIKELETASGKPIHIAVEHFSCFYPAEEYHQDYYLKHPEEFEQVYEGLVKIPEVVECHYTTGQYDMFIKVYAHNNHHLLSIIHDKLQPLGLARSETIVSFHEAFRRQMPIPEIED